MSVSDRLPSGVAAAHADIEPINRGSCGEALANLLDEREQLGALVSREILDPRDMPPWDDEHVLVADWNSSANATAAAIPRMCAAAVRAQNEQSATLTFKQKRTKTTK